MKIDKQANRVRFEPYAVKNDSINNINFNKNNNNRIINNAKFSNGCNSNSNFKDFILKL